MSSPGAAIVEDLIPFISGGRLNVYKSLTSLFEPQVVHRILTGVQFDSRTYKAISSIDVHDYVCTDWDISVLAGEQIVLGPGTSIVPGGESQSFVVDPGYFACSIPAGPMDLTVYAPDEALCGAPFGVAANADVDGGLQPYTYIWYSRLIADSEWYQHGASYPTMLFMYSDHFYWKLLVTDALGQTAEAGPEIVVCFSGLIEELNPTPTNTETQRCALIIVPNPVHSGSSLVLGRSGLVFGLGDRIRVVDELGRLVMNPIQPSESSASHSILIPQNLSAGLYIVEVESGGTIQRVRFVVSN